MDKLDIQALKKYSLEDLSLRDYQQENKQKVYDAWESTNSVMLQMPTGTGKTRLFVSIINDFIRIGKEKGEDINVIILVHRIELIDQVDKVLSSKYNLKHGIIHSGEIEEKHCHIQLASVPTLSRRLNRWSDKYFDLIVVDEAHHITADSYQKILDAFPEAKLLGVTATPVRLNGQGFNDTFDELIASPSIQTFIAHGYLSRYEYYSVGRSSYIQREIDSIRKFQQGDYAESELIRVCDTDRIRAQIIDTYLKFANGKKGIVYTINKEHNQHICERFKANGVTAVAIDSDTPPYMRKSYIDQFRDGQIKIICNVNIFTEGFDCPEIEFIQLARPTKSLALYLQQIGRGLRISDNKEKTLFLDNVGLYNRFGFPSAKRMWKHHFEGKYVGNQLEEDEPTLISFTSKKGNLKVDYTEGSEEVHLIQSTSEQKHLEDLFRFFAMVILWYIDDNIDSMRESFSEYAINGLGIHTDFYYPSNDNFYDVFHVYIKERSKEIRRFEAKNKFDFRSSPRELITEENYRKCNSLDELIKCINKEFHKNRLKILKPTIKDIVHLLKRYTVDNFENIFYRKRNVDTFKITTSITEGEVFDVFNNLIKINPPTEKVPDYFDGETTAVFVYFINFISDVHHTMKNVPPIINWMEEAIWDALHKYNSQQEKTDNMNEQ